MVRNAIRTALAALATTPLLVFGAAQASAIPVVEGVPGGTVDGRLYDHAGTESYRCVMVGQPGVGYGTNEAGQDGYVNGVFVGPGNVNHLCYGSGGTIHNGTGHVS
ncbi:hypothetical protein OED52_00965 [Rhodococcus sp. Z13]|uniref:Uncharacterized protein n=1 Tax=Rhodococcus sacchari TaxID=2962047 RepID=A0ACD4DGL7_9NOCA|nr:hypothetical protein [Rhodococcus sp. Z13]UYP19194.1 hypothetical protein OED52_00965 [Rhodococcus sp. Z13]